MGKFKGKNFQGTDERKRSKMNKPKGTVDKDNFFMKPKIKQSKSFEGGQMKNSKDNFFIKRKGMNKTKSFKIEQTNNDDNFFLAKTSDETKSSEVEQIEKTQNDHTDLKEEKIKIPFDKRKWRLQKYSNKYKVDKWKEMREKKILNQYQKFTKKQDDKGLDIQKIYEKYDQENSGDEMDPVNFLDGKAATSNEKGDSNGELISEDSRSKRKSGPLTRKDKLQEIKEEKERKRQEYLKKKVEKEEALRLSRKKKAERYKRLNKRTKKGQPIMKDRMEMLFEQVQKMCQE